MWVWKPATEGGLEESLASCWWDCVLLNCEAWSSFPLQGKEGTNGFTPTTVPFFIMLGLIGFGAQIVGCDCLFITTSISISDF